MSDSNLEQEALRYKKAADNGNINAMYNYSMMLYNGKGVKKNEKEGLEKLVKVSEAFSSLEEKRGMEKS